MSPSPKEKRRKPAPLDGEYTLTDYAKLRGVSVGYISKRVTAGVIHRNEYGYVNAKQATKAMDDYADPAHKRKDKFARKVRGGTRTNPPLSGDKTTIAYWRREDLRAKAELRQLEHDQLVGKLVLNDDELAKGYDAGKHVKDNLMQVVDRLAALLAAENDEFTVREMLTKEFTQVCEELANG